MADDEEPSAEDEQATEATRTRVTFESGSCGHVATRCECDWAASRYYGRP